jgi:hypothetical protein
MLADSSQCSTELPDSSGGGPTTRLTSEDVGVLGPLTNILLLDQPQANVTDYFRHRYLAQRFFWVNCVSIRNREKNDHWLLKQPRPATRDRTDFWTADPMANPDSESGLNSQ